MVRGEQGVGRWVLGQQQGGFGAAPARCQGERWGGMGGHCRDSGGALWYTGRVSKEALVEDREKQWERHRGREGGRPREHWQGKQWGSLGGIQGSRHGALRGTRGGSTCGDTVDMGVASTVGVARNLGTGKLGQLWSVGAGGHGHEETWRFGGTLALLGHKAPGEWHLLWPGCPRRPNTNRLWRGWGSLGTGGTLAPGWL